MGFISNSMSCSTPYHFHSFTLILKLVEDPAAVTAIVLDANLDMYHDDVLHRWFRFTPLLAINDIADVE